MRSCNDQLAQSKVHTTAEIICWYKPKECDKIEKQPWCITLAYWVNYDDGLSLNFVVNRPFMPEVNKDIFWQLAKQGNELLNEIKVDKV